MLEPEFCHWLKGVLESNPNHFFDERQTTLIKNKLDTVFVHVVEKPIVTLPNNGKPYSSRLAKC